MSEHVKELFNCVFVAKAIWVDMDVLGDVLRFLRLRGSVYFSACFCSPWGMEMARDSRAAFHLIVRGNAWLKLESRPEPFQLKAGDIVLFPTGAPHLITDQPGRECIPGTRVVEAYQSGEALFEGSDESSDVVCGYVEFDRSQSHPFLDNLPEFIHITADMRSRFAWLDSVLKQIAFESENLQPGKDVLIDRFTEILFIQIIRSYAENEAVQENYLSALMDTPLSKALSLIHLEPEKSWTIDMIANAVGLSRSVFYKRFNDYVGMPPMQYLFEWRMMKAKDKIESTQKSLQRVAEEVGYQSDSAFQKAFKRFFSRTPASLRK